MENINTGHLVVSDVKAATVLLTNKLSRTSEKIPWFFRGSLPRHVFLSGKSCPTMQRNISSGSMSVMGPLGRGSCRLGGGEGGEVDSRNITFILLPSAPVFLMTYFC